MTLSQPNPLVTLNCFKQTFVNSNSIYYNNIILKKVYRKYKRDESELKRFKGTKVNNVF